MEIGTAAGKRAELMIRAALKHHAPSKVEYYGFDLFGRSPKEELSPRIIAPPMREVRLSLQKTGSRIRLFKGDTKKTLPKVVPMLPVMDLIFIDGGHSEETVRSDWENVQPLIGPETVVVFDDYWNFPGGGGCKPLVDTLKRFGEWRVDVLNPVDVFERPYGELRTQVARVIPA